MSCSKFFLKFNPSANLHPFLLRHATGRSKHHFRCPQYHQCRPASFPCRLGFCHFYKSRSLNPDQNPCDTHEDGLQALLFTQCRLPIITTYLHPVVSVRSNTVNHMSLWCNHGLKVYFSSCFGPMSSKLVRLQSKFTKPRFHDFLIFSWTSTMNQALDPPEKYTLVKLQTGDKAYKPSLGLFNNVKPI